MRPPPAFQIESGDKLYIRSVMGGLALLTVTIRGSVLGPGGTIQTFVFTHQNSVVQTPQFETFDLPDGFLIRLSVQGTGTFLVHGTAYVDVGVLTTPALGQEQYGLIAGYLEKGRVLSYPQTRYEPLGSGADTIGIVVSADPAAGAEATHTIPVSERWRLYGVRATLVTDATVANRLPRLEIFRLPGIVVYRSRVHDPQTAGQAIVYNWVLPGFYAQTPLNSENNGVLPDAYLLAGDTIRTATVGLQAGDNWTSLIINLGVWMQNLA